MLPSGDDNSSVRTVPIVTYVLIALNVLFFFVELSGGEAFITKWAFVPSRFLENPAADFITLFTSMFMHGGFWHLAGNMLYLWIFGNNIEDAMGHGRFFAFYVLCGVAAVFAQVLPNPGSIIPMVGASGAISGVLGAYMLLFPRARVLLGLPLGFLLLQLGRFPAIWVLAAWFFMQLVMSAINTWTRAAGETQGGIAFGAHIGGFIAGLLLVAIFKKRSVPLWRRH
jgi:membrane associated rhomboid family serine protease